MYTVLNWSMWLNLMRARQYGPIQSHEAPTLHPIGKKTRLNTITPLCCFLPHGVYFQVALLLRPTLVYTRKSGDEGRKWWNVLSGNSSNKSVCAFNASHLRVACGRSDWRTTRAFLTHFRDTSAVYWGVIALFLAFERENWGVYLNLLRDITVLSHTRRLSQQVCARLWVYIMLFWAEYHLNTREKQFYDYDHTYPHRDSWCW